MTKGQAKERFNLLPDDFIGLSYVEKPIRGRKYCAHMFKTEDARRRAIELGRIPDNMSRPLPQPIHLQPVTIEQILLSLPGCGFVRQQLESWVWRAIVHYYEGCFDLDFSYRLCREDVAYQLRSAVIQVPLLVAKGRTALLRAAPGKSTHAGCLLYEQPSSLVICSACRRNSQELAAGGANGRATEGFAAKEGDPVADPSIQWQDFVFACL